MLRVSQRKVGIHFHPDCPDHIKQRYLRNTTPEEPTAIHLRDRQWICGIWSLVTTHSGTRDHSADWI